MIMVTDRDALYAIKTLTEYSHLSFDTETTGLRPYLNSELFSVVISCKDADVYFDFNPRSENPLDKVVIEYLIKDIFLDDTKYLFAHNAKFDLHFLNKAFPFVPKATIHDTEVIARVLKNDHMSYKLADVAARYGYEKLGAEVEEWISANEAFVEENGEKRPCYEMVPLDIMARYASRDSRITYDIGMKQIDEIQKQQEYLVAARGPKFIAPDIERKVTPCLYQMERDGVRINLRYAKEAYEYESSRVEDLRSELNSMVGGTFVDSSKELAPILQSQGVNLKLTPKGELSVDSWNLEYSKNALAEKVLEYRNHNKRSTTYWLNIIKLTDKHGFIHPSFRQSGAITLRMSCTDPNLQNQPKEDDSDYPIRAAFIPREGHTFVEFDYAAQEFRMAVDYAREEELAAKIVAGYDPHQAAADITGLTRKQAKIMNFALLYGAGKAKIAGMLGCEFDEAGLFKARYFKALPGIKGFLRRATDAASSRGYILNWAGVKYNYPDSKFAYKAANALIQGGCSYATKSAIVEIFKLLEGKKTKCLITVHDSILFDMHPNEYNLIDQIRECMLNSYPHKIMPMGSSVEYSLTDWHNLVKGDPRGDTTGSKVSS